MLSLRNRLGVVLPDWESVAKEITAIWSDNMATTCKVSLVDVSRLMSLKPLLIPCRCIVSKQLFESLNTNSAPRFDGFQFNIYKKFATFFAPRMLEILQLTLKKGSPDPGRSLAPMNPIPKAMGIVGTDELRPLALQNTSHKWFMSCITCRLKDLIVYVTPVQQKGSQKGRFICEHLWDALGSWSAIDTGAFTSIDFSKALCPRCPGRMFQSAISFAVVNFHDGKCIRVITPRGRLKRSARAVQLFGRLAVLETHTLRY